MATVFGPSSISLAGDNKILAFPAATSRAGISLEFKSQQIQDSLGNIYNIRYFKSGKYTSPNAFTGEPHIVTISFASAFPTACQVVLLTTTIAGAAAQTGIVVPYVHGTPTTTYFQAGLDAYNYPTNPTITYTFHWMALGY